MSTIDLGECENLLRKYYNLTNNETIYMKKIDIIQDGMTAKKIKYNVYSKLSGKNLAKLNLTICENAKIYINIPIEINGNVDKLNTSSGYFNDICYATTSEDGTDISLQDRKKEYIDGDNIICQDDCEFSSYNSEYKSARCDCFAKEFNSSYTDMTIIKNKLFENFKDIKNLMNYNILICYKKLLPIKRLAYNVSCIIILFFIFFHIISFFYFVYCQLKKIKKAIQNIIFALTNMSLIKNFNINTNRMKTKNITQRNNNINKSNNWINGKNKIEEQNQNKLILNKNNFLDKNKNRENAKKTTNIITENINSTNRSSFGLNYNDKIKRIKKLMEYNSEEMNDLSYNLALNYDKRTFCQYYRSLLKLKHCLFFFFFNNDDYNPKIIKIDLFFIGFGMDYIINALFFNDETMHKIYVNKGLFDWETQIPITIYSFFISMILNFPLSFLGLSNDSIINFK